MAETSFQLLLTPNSRVREATDKRLSLFVQRAADRTGTSVTMVSGDDVTGGLLVTLPLHEELLARFLTHLHVVLPESGELVPLRVAIHSGAGSDSGYPDEQSLAVLHRLADADLPVRINSTLEALISAQVATVHPNALEAFQETSIDDEPVWLWRASFEEPGHAIRSLALTLHGRQVITGHADGVIRRWDTSTGAPAGKPFTRHGAEVCAIAVTPCGEQVMSGDRNGVIWRWHAATLEPIGDQPSVQNGPVLALAATPDGREFITSDKDGQILVWNVSDGRQTRTFEDSDEPLRAVAVAPDGQWVATPQGQGAICFWDLESGSLDSVMPTDEPDVNALAYSLDGNYLVLGSESGRIRASPQEGGPSVYWPVHTSVLALAITPDGQRCVSGGADGTLRRWHLATGDPIGGPWTGHWGGVSAVAVTPDGRLIVSGGADGVLRRWDAHTGEPLDEAEQLADVASDMESAEDALGIAGDVRTIATVLAAMSTQPPLSVALLGDWGAGKSSFMRQLQAKVSELSTSDAQLGDRNAYAGNVRQVTFNAWHYSDDHLWVGLIEHLFRTLADEPDPGRIGELEAKLADEEAEHKTLRRRLDAIPVWSGIRHELRGWRLWLGIAVLLGGVAVVVFGRGVLAWVVATVALLGPAAAAWSWWRRHVAATKQKLLERKAELEQDIEATTAELAELDPARRLERLLTEITEADRYASFRGLTGRIHHDLRRLSDDLAFAREQWDGTGSPPLQRIVLYVDDLDRCAHGRVVDVLQAVNLLLTMDLFMVVVAVDPKWLLRSLRSHHGEDARPVAYLDKIFHIPFALRPMGDHATDYLLSLLPPEPTATQLEPEPDAPVAETATVPQPSSPAQPQPPQPTTVLPSPVDYVPAAALTAAGLRMTRAEREFLARLTPLLTTPRAVKKLANLYRLLRLSVPSVELPDFLAGPYQAAALLLAALAGEPTGIRALLTALAECQTDQDIVDTLRATESPLGTRLAELILSIRKDLPVHTDTTTYRQWATEVARFGFETYDLYAC